MRMPCKLDTLFFQNHIIFCLEQYNENYFGGNSPEMIWAKLINTF